MEKDELLPSAKSPPRMKRKQTSDEYYASLDEYMGTAT